MSVRKRHAFNLLAGLSRLIGFVFSNGFLVLCAAYFITGVGPHLRWTYSYREGYGGYRAYISCTYLGPRGLIAPDVTVQRCPVVIWANANEWRRP